MSTPKYNSFFLGNGVYIVSLITFCLTLLVNDRPIIRLFDIVSKIVTVPILLGKFKTKIDSDNINKIAKGYDLIVDGTDSFKSKLLISDYCYKNKKILICGAISKFDGHVFVFNFKKKNSPCLRCFMPEIPTTDMMDCQNEGVLSTLAGMIGTIMANEAIREILNFENSLCGNILIINAENLLIKKIKLNKNKNCIKKIK